MNSINRLGPLEVFGHIKEFFNSLLTFLKNFISDIFKALSKNLNSEDWKDVIFLTLYLSFIFGLIFLLIYFISSCSLDISHFYLT